jgi:hypothetical protein
LRSLSFEIQLIKCNRSGWLNTFQKKVIAKSWSPDILHWMEVGLNATLLRRGFSHRIDTRPEETLLCVLAWENIQKIFTCYIWCHPGVYTQDGVIWWCIFTSALVKFRTRYYLSDTSGPVSILCVSCLMIYYDEIHFTTLYMADLGTRAESLGEVVRVERQKPLWRREGMQHVRTAYLFFYFLIKRSCLQNVTNCKPVY